MSHSGGFRQLLRVLSWPRQHVGTSGRVGLEQKEEEQPLGTPAESSTLQKPQEAHLIRSASGPWGETWGPSSEQSHLQLEESRESWLVTTDTLGGVSPN